jgi:DNA-directed RNA polymerase subunit omega
LARRAAGIRLGVVFRAGDFYHPAMRSDYLREALKKIDDPNILINVVSRRVKQLRRGNRALVESLEKLSAEDIALREVIEGKISYDLADADPIVPSRGLSRSLAS